MTNEEILNLSMQENDADASTIKEYLIKLLLKLWSEGEGFSGKRPFGNSSWEYELFIPLIKNGLIRGKLDSYGYIDDCDNKKGFKIIEELIKSL